MDLILWRHAEAQDAEPGASDLDRPLTKRGRKQAMRMATWLQQELPSTTRILVSPSRRTQETVAPLGRKFKLVDDLGPHGNVEMLLQAARWPESREPVMVVGHQDTLGLAAAWLMTGATHPWTIKRGAVWWLRHRVREGEAQVLLHLVMPPECAIG